MKPLFLLQQYCIAQLQVEISQNGQLLLPKTNPTLWIDITQLINWKGTLTGIQRTQYSLAKEFANDKSVSFFYWDGNLGFVETTFGTLESKLKPEFSEEDSLIRTKQKKVFSILRRSRYLFLSLFSKKKIHETAYLNSRLNNSLFSSGDKVLLMGPTWVQQDLLSDLGCLKSKTKIKIYLTVYDLIPQLFPHFFEDGIGKHFSEYLPVALEVADYLCVISESTANDLKNYSKMKKISIPPILQFTLGSDFCVAGKPKGGVNSFEINGDYVLSVGTFEIRKNYELLYKVWKSAKKVGIELPNLLIVGKPGWKAGHVEKLIRNDKDLSKKIQILSKVNDSDLYNLYKNSLFTIFPSFYEGWGLPVVESLSLGKFALVSNTSSMPEAGGNFVEYFDPHSEKELMNLILKYGHNLELLKSRNDIIRDEYIPVTWKKSFNELSDQIWNS